MDRKSTETTYFSFIRPKLDHAAQVWDNCTQRDAELLEALQLHIARTATGAQKGCSNDFIKKPTGKCQLNVYRIQNTEYCINHKPFTRQVTMNHINK